MFLTSSLLHLPTSVKLNHPSPFLHGGSSSSSSSSSIPTITLLPKSTPPTTHMTQQLTIQAMKKMQGRVVCSTNDKTVSVEVVRLAPHPKYKRRIRIKKKYQAHDPENQFKVGDLVQLEKSRPISKTKTFVAVPFVSKNRQKVPENVAGDLGLSLESEKGV